jgi:hypothetical protein
MLIGKQQRETGDIIAAVVQRVRLGDTGNAVP